MSSCSCNTTCLASFSGARCCTASYQVLQHTCRNNVIWLTDAFHCAYCCMESRCTLTAATKQVSYPHRIRRSLTFNKRMVE
eukprot:scaffold20961_cov24-Tisochrysis_lutea.AAC.1